MCIVKQHIYIHSAMQRPLHVSYGQLVGIARNSGDNE